MAQVVEDREKSTHHMSNFPRDLLNRFMSVNHHHHHHHQNQFQHHDDDGDVEEEIELSLGLSMNGRFGVDPTAAKKIKRTTSIPEFVMNMNHPSLKDEDSGYPVPSMPCSTSLIRTCSLPTETEEEWRKRKELQTLRRLEARRKRSEKQRNLKALREQQQRNRCGLSEEVVGVGGSNNSCNNLVEQGAGNNNEFGGLGRTTSLSSRVSGLGLNGDKEKEKEKGGLPPPSPSRGSSIGSSSQGTGSSGISESESQQQGSKLVDARSPIGPNSLPSCDRRSPAASSGARIAENSIKIAAMAAMRNESNKNSLPESKTKDIVRNLLEDMPSVSTKGDGPNGRRIEGFLYRYGKGEEVRIVCVCHGSFLTPAEFVKHAGGGDVANPLKHIVVSPSCL